MKIKHFFKSHAKLIKFMLMFIFLSILIAGGFVFFVLSGSGSRFFLPVVLRHLSGARTLETSSINGGFLDHLVLKDLVFKDWPGLPDGYALRVQKLDFFLTGIGLEGLNLEIHNGRFSFDGSMPLVFDGDLQGGELDFSFYSEDFYLASLRPFFSDSPELRKVGGIVRCLDAHLTGPLADPSVSGSFSIAELTIETAQVLDCRATFDVKVKFDQAQLIFKGRIDVLGGRLKLPYSEIELGEGQIFFEGEPDNPRLHLDGSSLVQGVKIKISLRGILKEPVLKVSSDPALPEMKILAMLATGKSWSGVEDAWAQGEVTPQIAAEFLDFFFLGKLTGGLAQRLNITNFSVKNDGSGKGVNVAARVSPKTELRYGIERSGNQTSGESLLTQRVGVGYDLTDELSLEAQTRAVSAKSAANHSKTQLTPDALYLKYRKSF